MVLGQGRYGGREHYMMTAVAQGLNFTLDITPHPTPVVSNVSKHFCPHGEGLVWNIMSAKDAAATIALALALGRTL